jgi:FKBP-type peptidyl-prolyl cis-trans isomerase
MCARVNQLLALALLFAVCEAFKAKLGLQMAHEGLPSSARKSLVAGLMRTSKVVASAAALVGSGAVVANAYGPVEEKTKPKAKPKTKETDLGIPFVELKKGDGPYPGAGDFVAINYIGFLPDGTVFDETHEKKALSFTFGKKQVIPGLESVIELMQPGGECTTIIPSKYAYGEKGVCVAGQSGKECLVPPNTNLKYFIKLKRVGAGYN